MKIKKERSLEYQKFLEYIKYQNPCAIFEKNPYEGDEELLRTAIKASGSVFEELEKQSDHGVWGKWKGIVNDKEWVLDSLKEGGPFVLRHISEPLKSDEQVVEMVLSQYPQWFSSLSDKCMRNMEWVQKAIKGCNGANVKSLINRLEKSVLESNEIKMDLIRMGVNIFKFDILESWWSDKDLVESLLRVNPSVIDSIRGPFIDSEDILLMGESKYILKNASERLKKDRSFVSACIEKSGANVAFADEKYKNDEEMMLKAVKTAGVFLMYGSEDIKNNPTVVKKAIQKHPWSKKYAGQGLMSRIEIIRKKSGITWEEALDYLVFEKKSLEERSRLEVDLKEGKSEKKDISNRFRI